MIMLHPCSSKSQLPVCLTREPAPPPAKSLSNFNFTVVIKYLIQKTLTISKIGTKSFSLIEFASMFMRIVPYIAIRFDP